jgi:hypothetical protein
MYTFLPYPDFHQSALALEPRRLSRQRVEALYIYDTMTRSTRLLPTGKRFRGMNTLRMWWGYDNALAMYIEKIIEVWKMRGNENLIRSPMYQLDCRMPPWLGDYTFHSAQRSYLLRKDPDWYSQWGWKEPDNLPYIWPHSDIPISFRRR